LPTAARALAWCEELGDRDGDGFLEYETRSSSGYCNQSWKDSVKAIVDVNGNIAAKPLAAIELQGYSYAARLAGRSSAGEGEDNDRCS
jgi:glycogen debranching enzyme